MNISISARDLLVELLLLEKIVNKKPTIPVLSHVLLQAHGEWLHLSATDLEYSLVTCCPAAIEVEGAITLNSQKLTNLVKSLSDAELHIKFDEQLNKTVFTADKYQAKLQGIPAQDFPTIAPASGQSTQINREDFCTLIERTRYAVNDGIDGRYALQGALLALPENDVTMVATDSKRLSLAGATREGSEYPSIIIPHKTLDLLLTLLHDSSEETITFTSNDQHLFFEVDGRLVSSSRLNGAFPEYKRIIPEAAEHVVTLDRVHLLTTIERALLISSTIEFTLRSDQLEVTSKHHDIGEGLEPMPVAYKGEDLAVKLQGRYVVDFLKAASSPSVLISIRSSKSPVLFSEGEGFVNVIMPIIE